MYAAATDPGAVKSSGGLVAVVVYIAVGVTAGMFDHTSLE